MITRDTILEELTPYFADPRYYLLVCDMGFGKMDKLSEEYPGRVINCGIAEQSTIGIASGMAEAGLLPVVYSIASFLVYRALEQIKNDIVERKVNVKLIGSGSGDFFKDMGRCHWCKDDDIKLMNIIGMPVYDGSNFKQWISSSEGGYIRV
jgi:transketolase